MYKVYINYSSNNNNYGEDNTTSIAGTAEYALIHPVHVDSGNTHIGGQVIKVSSDCLCIC
jgi:hypothetical protein